MIDRDRPVALPKPRKPKGLQIDPRTGCPRYHLYDAKGGGCMAPACPNSTGPDLG